MNKKSFFVDFSLLKTNRHFRNVFIARTISLLGLGMLAVAIPMQVYQLSGDSFQVGLVMALEGAGMFAGLLLGGVLADRDDRKKLILFARAVCGIGFLGLAVNAWLPQPQLWVIYLLAVWDGFFGAIGVTALLACMPFIVGRENLLQARAVSMLSVRLATVISPALGGLIIAFADVGWNYLIAALGTGLTLIPLLALPSMRPQEVEEHHPLKALAAGFRYLFANRIVFYTVLAGTLVTLTTAIRVLFPALVEDAFAGGAAELGLMYSAVPLGATLGALVSGWASHVQKPGQVMLFVSLAAFACMMALGLNHSFITALFLLAAFGYLVSIASLLQYNLVQINTPDQYLGRINGIWTAQDASGDSLGTLGIGVLGKFMSSLGSIFTLGAVAMTLGVLLLGNKTLRGIENTDG
ncbi:enterobactin transporter EntS [Thalassolituus sp. C2-1]|jgi:MFS transporter, ENTS family, enterobactin (siderophore) exporter|uniref:enterobactin transporter EntS n=1 Tax=Venatorbacter sp. C2-1 TaxID=2597518 RepID=UPI0011941FB8|nr:enterobactin transporter EntS [Thalassolituus sp. C2-1]TVV43081.1 enterobactin transporter EntS [Thalassolituus sp. C2-1]